LGRPRSEIDITTLMSMQARGATQDEMQSELGVSKPTLQKRIAEIQEKQGILLKYRDLQSLQLTSLQARVLEAITPEKINEAPLRDLVVAFKILKEKEHLLEGKPGEIKGLVGYLIEMEKKESAEEGADPAIDVEFTKDDSGNETGVRAVNRLTNEEYVPDLSDA